MKQQGPFGPIRLDFAALERERRKLGISRAELARRAGVNPATVWRMERSKTWSKGPSMVAVVRVARALGRHIMDLYEVIEG